MGVLPWELPPHEDDDEAAYRAMIRLIRGEQHDEDEAFLEEDPDDWRRMMVAHKIASMRLLTVLDNAKKSRRKVCERDGTDDEPEWHAWLAEMGVYRSAIIAYNIAADRWISHVNELRHKDAQDANVTHAVKLSAAVARIEELERVVAALVAGRAPS